MLVNGRLLFGGENIVDGNVNIDVFTKKTQKINIVVKLTKAAIPRGYNMTGLVEVTSRGQQLKVDLKEYLALSMNEIGFGSWLSYNDVEQKPKMIGMQFSANAKEAHLLVKAPSKNVIKMDSTINVNKNLQKIDTDLQVLDKTYLMNLEAKDLNSVKFLFAPKGGF